MEGQHAGKYASYLRKERARKTVRNAQDEGGIGPESFEGPRLARPPESPPSERRYAASEPFQEPLIDAEELAAKESAVEDVVEVFPGAGEPVGPALDPIVVDWSDPLFPLSNPRDHALAEWFVAEGISQSAQDSFLKGACGGFYFEGVPAEDRGFTSAKTMLTKVDSMADALPASSWQAKTCDFEIEGDAYIFYHRDPLQCVKHLLKQPQFTDHLKYGPERHFGPDGRIYHELYTADWWWTRQEEVLMATGRRDATIVPLVLSSDQTHLSNFSGDKKAWPIYLTLGNLRLEVRNSLPANAILPIAMLPVPPKLQGKTAAEKERCREVGREVLHACLNLLFGDIETDTASSLVAAGRHGIEMDCADGNRRLCFPTVVGWCADHMEDVSLHGINKNACPVCEVPEKSLGAHPAAAASRAHDVYQRQYFAGDMGHFAARGVKFTANPLWCLPGITADQLWKPDILHNIHLGMLKHAMDWINGFLIKHERMAVFNRIWLSLPGYHDFTPPTKPYAAVVQWTGKEMRAFARVILPCFAAALASPRPRADELNQFHNATRCIRGLAEFCMITSYPIHNALTLQWLDAALDLFHKYKDSFSEWRLRKGAKMEAKNQRRNAEASLIRRWQEQNVGRRRSRPTAAEMSNMRDIAAAEAEELARELATFNFPKCHLLSHFSASVPLYGALSQWSTEPFETMHKREVKTFWARSNKRDAMEQILVGSARSQQFFLRRQQREYLYMRDTGLALPDELGGGRPLIRTRSAARTKTLVSDAGSSSIPRPLEIKLAGRQTSRKRIHDIGVLARVPALGIAHFVQAYYRRELNILGADAGRISRLPATLWHSLSLPVSSFYNEDLIQFDTVRCTGRKTWYGGKPRNDFCWLRTYSGSPTDASPFRRLLPVRLCSLFSIEDPRLGSPQHVALVRRLRLYNSPEERNFDVSSGLCRVVEDANVGGNVSTNYKVVPISHLASPAHLVPIHPDAAEGERRDWWVNSTIDHWNYNMCYMREPPPQ